MGRKEAASKGSSRSRAGLHVDTRARRSWWPLSAKRSVVLAAVAILLGIVGFALIREATMTAPGTSLASSRPPAAPPEPAFTPAEAAYIRALWPIHGEVERSTVRMSLGQIFYKINDMDEPTLKGRVDDALATYQRSEARLQGAPAAALGAARARPVSRGRSPPPRLRRPRCSRCSTDGRDDHMNAAYPLSQKASDKIREVGAKFWRDEFPPN